MLGGLLGMILFLPFRTPPETSHIIAGPTSLAFNETSHLLPPAAISLLSCECLPAAVDLLEGKNPKQETGKHPISLSG